MKNKDPSYLVVKEVRKVVNEKFSAYTNDILKIMRNYGFKDLKTLGLAFAVSNFLAEACTTKEKYCSPHEITLRTEGVKRDYLKNLEGRISNKQHLTFDDMQYYANETLVNLLQDRFNISFSLGHTLPGCFEHSSKKEKY